MSGIYSIIPGGVGTFATNHSFATGRRAKAMHNGSFVWGDSADEDVSSTSSNQFIIRASGGVGIGVEAPEAALHVAGAVKAESFVGMGAPLLLATTDDQPLEFRVNGEGAFRLEPTTNSPNVVGGFEGNVVGSGISGATITGGGSDERPNTLEIFTNAWSTEVFVPHFGTIGGGSGNRIASADHDTIAGGASNSITGATSLGQGKNSINGGAHNRISNVGSSIIAGGSGNAILGSIRWGRGEWVIGGGMSNIIQVFDAQDEEVGVSTIAGGSNSSITSGSAGTVGGGLANRITWHAGGNHRGGNRNYVMGLSSYTTAWGTIAGGNGNVLYGGYGGVLSGGENNNMRASWGSVGGGYGNTIWGAAESSTIGGGESNAVWGAYGAIPGGQDNYATNYCLAAERRAKALHSGGFVWGDSTDADVESSSTNQFTVRATGGARFFTDTNLTAGVELAPGSGSWSTLSDRNAKTNFTAIQAEEVLERLTQIPISTWNYKTQDASIRHIGPTAQDFRTAFQLGEDECRISTVDADGVALAAIQGLNLKLEEQAAQIRELKRTVDEFRRLLKSKVSPRLVSHSKRSWHG